MSFYCKCIFALLLDRSREDYIYTDEELDLLQKFPRNNLKLENFIDRGEFGEVFQGTAMDILGPGTGPMPVAVKVAIMCLCINGIGICND